jgi:alkylation response protein AidB-like acyl-CoA dehydrogenase
MTVELVVAPTEEQAMLLSATARFIADACPLERVRQLADGGDPVGPDYFLTAGSLGWFGMLASEAGGGGSVSGNGVVDAAIIAAERGAALQPGDFVGANVVAHALSSSTGDHGAALTAVIDGSTHAAWLCGDAGVPDASRVTAHRDRDRLVLDGDFNHVTAPDAGAVLLVLAHGDDGELLLLVSANAPGVEVRPLDGLDLTRRAGAVSLAGVAVEEGALVTSGGATSALVARLDAIASVLSAAESVGAMHQNFSMALEYSKERIAFGRPIGSFQALKHLIATTSLDLEMAKALVATAAQAVGAGEPDGGQLAHAAKAFVAERSVELTHSCFQVFGGIGFTWEHDHHLYMRRLTAEAQMYGSVERHERWLADRIGAA